MVGRLEAISACTFEEENEFESISFKRKIKHESYFFWSFL